MGEIASSEPPRVFGLSRNVFFLGLVSFFTDVSTELVFTIMPLFLANVLKVGTPIIGLIAGFTESTEAIVKGFSGWFSDRLGRRKSFAALGYGLSTIAKPFLYFANTWGLVLAVRFADRLGKGVRTSPRDALVADSSSPGERGKSFGFHRAMDTFGAALGLSLAASIVFIVQKGSLNLARDTYRLLVLAGIVPAVIAVLIILSFVREPRTKASGNRGSVAGSPAASSSTAKGFDARFKVFLVVMVIFTLGNSSDAFLILRAQNLGISVVHILLLLIAFNLVYALTAWPAGLLSDRLGRKGVIILGWTIYALTYLGFGVAATPWQVWLLFGCYGLYYGLTAGAAPAFVADTVSAEKRGTAYGLYHAAIGVTALPASVIAGWLWQAVSPGAPFLFGAGLAAVATVSFLALIR